jgi:SAM-dependent methyltransferase
MLLDYQQHALDCFFRARPCLDGVILELGSDVEGTVCRALADRTTGEVIGMNPHPEFPHLPSGVTLPERVRLLREDGRSIPLPDNSVDAVFTVATVEHVLGLDAFYAEIRRVLKPGGLLHADFAPVWSSHVGHHVKAICGDKQARFWQPGKNPVPDFGQLLMTPDEMRTFLKSGPCADELVEPIVSWIYFEDEINRCFLEDHLAALHKSGLWRLRLVRKPGVHPTPEQALRLAELYGTRRDFTSFGLEATMRKPGGDHSPMDALRSRVWNEIRDAPHQLARAIAPTLRQSKFFRGQLNKRRLDKSR